ncbi:hypothetical protein GII30_19830 [Gordonia amarae]|uniref:Mce-associated membrane protein n=2 Tax=Gordonia amarae TaxID=36821 RepID=G7GMD8_9ACTN|nr:hypothetical protein [Gordonia amarae]MCS3880691.1 hypothetical protein [Gordonia amarae]QHN18988.1 hypothetical protein GII35_20185 [Gordonia amarae]QHN23463.1 hypothetical protein GII34_19685 [Gordonia amarae]QHN32363.1 hypothetical protein GII32_20000 [Gordonia amarae]QHN41111.1 hypothetical protein GII30_19830 [Gordonia amarae]
MSIRRAVGSVLGRPIIGTRAAAAALAVAVLVVAVLAALVTVAARDNDGAVDRDGLRAESGRIVAAVFSVDAAGKKDSVASLVTDDFAATYGSLLRGTPASGVRSIQWRPTASAVIDAGPGWGATLTAFDVVTTADSGKAETGTRTLWIRLVRSGDTWKLARVEQTV